MKTSEIAIETIQGLDKLKEALLGVESIDKDYLSEIEFAMKMLKTSVFGHMVKYEYSDFYLKHKKKLNAEKFISNPEKTLAVFQNPTIQSLKKR
ncbi:MAG TPA: hypothetical protein PLX69_24865 [Leptospiraceae bacterium]|nr:hypothetical protein [Leptospiraceae bacterium]